MILIASCCRALLINQNAVAVVEQLANVRNGLIQEQATINFY
jgi:hypothetical protein